MSVYEYKCEYCEKEINPNKPYWTNSKDGKEEYYHHNCLIETVTFDCPKQGDCEGSAFENFEPMHNEAYD